MGNTEGISRRSFVGGAGTVALAAGVAGSLACANAASADEATAAQDGAQADVVIVGGGLAGLVAGLRVQELGKTALIVEKLSTTGGNSAVSGGTFILPPTDDEEGVEIFVEDLMNQSGGRADETLIRAAAERAWESRSWFADQGVSFVEPSVTVPFRVLGNTPEPGAYSMFDTLETLRERFESNGGTILLDTKVRGLVEDGSGCVVGVKARTADGLVEVTGGCVILASGGYSGNKNLLEQYIGPDADEMMVRGRATATGEAMLAAQDAGALLVQMGSYESLHIAAVSPENPAAGQPSPGIPYMVAINSEGKRFVDESLGYVNHGKAVAEQPGVKDALLFDAAQLEANGYVQYVWELFTGLELPDTYQAETLEELAEMIEVPADALVATIDEYNEHITADNTVEGLEVPKAGYAYPVSQPPFYALYPMVPGITLSFGGVAIDTSAHVLEPDGATLPGLYAAGEVTGGMFVNDYIAGASLTTTAVYALIAAETAVEELAS